jgi:hypothetical protein
MRSIPECEYRLMLLARDRNKDGRPTHVIDCECVLCEDTSEGFSTVMTYLTFGAPGDDPKEADVSDIVAIFYELDHIVAEENFDHRAAARQFAPLVQSINDGTAFRVY